MVAFSKPIYTSTSCVDWGIDITVCLAAISEKKDIIFATDRMMTIGFKPYQFSHGGQKLRKLGEHCVVAFSGNPWLMDCMIEGAYDRLATYEDPAEDPLTNPRMIIEAMKDAYNYERLKRIEEGILRKHGWTMEEYRDLYRNRRIWEDQLAMITTEIEKSDINMNMVVGVNAGGEIEIHIVHRPGASENVSAVGYHAIGTGGPYAMQTFMKYDYRSDFSFAQSLFIAFEAKKDGEKGTGVGEMTDLWILKENGIIELDEEQIVGMGKLLKERNKKLERLNIGMFRKVSEMSLP